MPLCFGGANNASLSGTDGRLNEVMYEKHLAEWLTLSRCIIDAYYYYRFFTNVY